MTYRRPTSILFILGMDGFTGDDGRITERRGRELLGEEGPLVEDG